MGQTSVAVLHNDMSGEIERTGGELGKRMSWAMNNWNPKTREGDFRVGHIISRDHSSAYQVIIVYGNTGRHISRANDISYSALSEMADCLRRHGWSAKPPPKRQGKERA